MERLEHPPLLSLLPPHRLFSLLHLPQSLEYSQLTTTIAVVVFIPLLAVVADSSPSI